MNLKEEVFSLGELTCPYCGTKESDSWELPERDDEFYCEVCDKYFAYEREIDVTYWSKKIEQPEREGESNE